MHKFSTAAKKSSGVLHRPCYATCKRVPPHVAERRQVGAFVASLQEPMHDLGSGCPFRVENLVGDFKKNSSPVELKWAWH